MPRKIKLDAEFIDTNTFISMIENRYGENIIDRNEEVLLRDIKVIPTGSISLDISTGVGGIPRGKFTEIFGLESSAKTSLCLSIAKQALNLGLRVLYVEPENTLDYKYIEAIVGTIDKENFILAQTETAEQALSICEAGVKSKEFQLIILDSVGALSSKAEQEDDLEKTHYAGISKLLTLFLKRNAFDVRSDEVAFIFVNQVRDNIGNPYGGVSTPGGHALRHFLALRIQLSRKDTISVTVNKDLQDDIGINSRFVIKKNKLAKPFRTFFFPFMFGEGIDTVVDTVNFAEMLRILTKRGSYYAFEGVTLGQGVANTAKYLREHSETLDRIQKMCYDSIVTNEGSMPVDDDEEGDTDDGTES